MSIIQGSANRASVRGFYPKTINGSLRFNDDDSAYLSWTPASAGNRKTWTFSCWFKPTSTFTTARALFSAGTGTTDATFGQILLANDSTIRVNGYSTTWRGTSRLFRDPSAWYHLVVLFDTTQATASDRVKVYINGTQETAFDINNNPTQNADYAFNQSAVHYIGRIDSAIGTNYLNEYLAEVFFIDGTAHTASDFGETKNGVWVPKNVTASNFTMGTNGFHLTFEDDTAVEAFNTVLYRGSGSNQTITGVGFTPDLVWIKRRDGIGDNIVHDSIRGNDGRNRLFPNSTSAESTNGDGFDHLESDGFSLDNTGSGGDHNYSGRTYVAWCWDAGANNAVTGHSSVTYTGSGATSQRITGFPFSPDLIWLKCRGAAENHNVMDTVRGWGKRLKTNATDAEQTFSGGGFYLDGFAPETTSDDQNKNGFEFVAWAWDAGDSDPVSNTTGDTTATVKTNGDFSIMAYSGTGAATSIGHGLSSAPNFVIVKDRSALQNWVVWTDDINTDGNQYLELNQASAIQSSSVFWNSTAPDASKIYLGTSNSISGRNFICYAWRNVTGKQKFGSYTGTGSTGLTVTTGFRPGFLMIKRDGFSHWEIHDGSRDPFANPSTKLLNANQSNVEDDNANGSFEFTDTGFIVQTSHEERNFNGDTYIYAAFAGSYSDYITDYNTDGSIDSRVKASQTYGFSICSFNSGASGTRSFGHGLGTTPSLCIFKERNSGGAGDHWVVWEGMTGNPATSYGYLNLTNAFGTDTSQWSNTAPTSTEFTFNSGYAWSINQDMIAYCWAEKTGYSKFGSYTGNGSSSGPSVTTNFNPACLIVKRTDTTGNWFIWDNTRDTDGVFNTNIHPNLSNAEAASGSNFVTPSSTGFQLTGTGAETNASGGTYIYAAFADTREAAFWLDQSSNNNDWQPVNLDHNDTVADSPTDNYPVLLLPTGSSYLDGPRKIGQTAAVSNTYRSYVASMAISSGKWYAEVTVNDVTRNLQPVGIFEMNDAFDPQSDTTFAYYGSRTGVSAQLHQNWAVFSQNGQIHSVYNGTNQASYGSATANGDTLMIALDMDNYKVWIGNNGTWFGDGNPSTGANPTFSGASFAPTNPVCFGGSLYQNRASNHDWNFGQRPFKYSPPE